MSAIRSSRPRRSTREARAAARVVALLFGLCGALASAAADAADFKSVGGDPAILYDAPTLRGTRTGIAPRGMPVEVVVAQGDWVRIRDAAGGFSWIERKALVDRRTVVVTDAVPAEIRATADDAAPSVFRAQSGVLLDLVTPPSGGWVGVRHRDGQSGFVKVGSVWGE